MTAPLDSSLPFVVWQARRSVWPLGVDEVHVWRLAVGEGSANELSLCESLSLAERRRAESYRRPEDRRRFAMTRGALRRLTACYCGLSPAEVQFGETAEGKPVLAEAAARSRLHFNVSHSGEIALLAFGKRRVGVDLEHMRAGVACLSIARRYFSTEEVADLETLPAAELAPAFYRCWTRKEAYVKGTGLGISSGLASFSVTCLPEEPAELIRPPRSNGTPWQLYDLPLCEGYVGSLAVEGSRTVRVELCSWPLDDP